MDETKTVGFTFFDGLMLLLVGLKLANIISWPWWCVIGLPFAILAGCVVVAVVVALVVALIGKVYDRLTSDHND